MRLIAEGRTRRLVVREREEPEEGQPAETAAVVQETVIEFGPQTGRSEDLDEDVAEAALERFDGLRPAEAEEDVAQWADPPEPPLEDVDFASDEAAELAFGEDLEPEDFEGRDPSGKTGHTTKDVRAVIAEKEDAG